jgi:hypothetical protein
VPACDPRVGILRRSERAATAGAIATYARLLHAAGDHAGLLDGVPNAVVRDRGLAQHPIEHGHELLEPGHELARW